MPSFEIGRGNTERSWRHAPPAVVALVAACVILGGDASAQSTDRPSGVSQAEESVGFFDGFNRTNRRFNFWLFDHVLDPAARGYNYVMPKWGQVRVQSFFENLERPRDFVNSLLQGKPRRAANHLGAFILNSTFGIGGLFAPADDILSIESPETTNETLGFYGIPPGGYIVLPLFGETCPRCLVGTAGDIALYPLFWIPGATGTYVSLGANGVNALNLIAKQMPRPFATDDKWDAYYERVTDRHSYREAKRLFFENLELDVAD